VPLRSIAPVRELLPAFVQVSGEHKHGAQVSKRYHPPETPYERLLQAETLSDAIKAKLREVSIALDPLKLLEEVRATQSHLVVLANGGRLDVPSMREPDLPAFLASLSSAWRAGEVRATHSEEAHPRYLRPLREVIPLATVATRQSVPQSKPGSRRNKPTVAIPVRPSTPQSDVEIERRCEHQRQDLARRNIRRIHAFTLVWPLVERRLEGRPNLNASELLDELRAQYPGRFHLGQLAALTRRVNLWREDARERSVVIGKPSIEHRGCHAPGERESIRSRHTGPNSVNGLAQILIRQALNSSPS